MKKVWKKRAVVGAVLLFVCAAVYMNWRYAGSLEDTSKVLGESTLVSGEKTGENNANVQQTANENDYFATARLSRKQARDNAISMLKDASTDENADQSVLNEASQTLQVLAGYTVAESQIEKSGHGQGLYRLRGLYGRRKHQRRGGGRGRIGRHGCGTDHGYCGAGDRLCAQSDQGS